MRTENEDLVCRDNEGDEEGQCWGWRDSSEQVSSSSRDCDGSAAGFWNYADFCRTASAKRGVILQ